MTETAIPAVARPKWVWALSIIYLILACMSLLSILAVASGSVPLSEAQRTYFDNWGWFGWGRMWLVVIVNAAFALYLFRMHRFAFYVFLVGIANALISGLYDYSVGRLGELMSTADWITLAVSTGINLLVLLYVWKLFRTGKLR